MTCRFGIGAVVLSVLVAGCFLPLASAKDEPKWIEVHTAHFSVLTDAGDKRGREVALRMEQMRAVFGQLLLKNKLKMPVPITVIALKSDKQYGMIAPAKQSMAGGFYVPGSDRVYIVLNLFEADPWRAVAHPLAHYLLNFNYPPAQGWFDEGLAEYFRVDPDRQTSGDRRRSGTGAGMARGHLRSNEARPKDATVADAVTKFTGMAVDDGPVHDEA